jgi:CDP-glycerol glycerophosphotransferase
MQELMAAVDVGITDYSSWIFDYLFTGRPAFIYAADIENYVNSRGFYYSLTETPFMIADSNTALCNNIANFEQADFDKKVQKFLEGKGCYEKGTATESTVEFIRQQIENNK